MKISSKSRPLIVLIGVGALLLLVRLWEVQIHEYTVWRTEAARLVHSGREIPYERGKILDTHGRVLARDRDTHHLVLVYREFRRGHPLGQVAHARSLLEERAVPLDEAAGHLRAWARELVLLSPAQLAEFGGGAELRTDSLVVPEATRGGSRERAGRGRRAADVGFYAKRLLGLESRSARRRLERLADRDGGDGAERAFLELAAEVEGVEPAQVWARIEARLARAMEQLDRLARLFEWPTSPEPGDGGTDGGDAPTRRLTPLGRLVHEVERTRRWVEDATASKLFAEATGFAPGLVDPATLRATVDLSWIGGLLAWDEARLAEWCRAARDGWCTRWRDGYVLPRLAWLMTLDPARRAGPDQVVSMLASLYDGDDALERALDGRATDWREVGALAAFDRLDGLFEAGLPRHLRPAGRDVLPFQDPALRSAVPPGAAGWGLIDAVATLPPSGATLPPSGGSLPPSDGSLPRPTGARVAEHIRGGRTGDVDEGLFPILHDVVETWDPAYQAALFDLLREIQAGSDADERSSSGRLLVARELRTRATERAEYLLRDYGMRPSPLLRGAPSYEVIYLLTRYAEDYPGFLASEAREREYPVPLKDAARPAAGLIGSVSAVGVRDLLRQRGSAEELRRLKGLPERSDEEELELERLIGEVLLHDEVKGVAGVEGFWNDELVGRNGYREIRGLEELSRTGDRQSLLEVENGSDVVLTLDVDLQRAARRTLQYPEAVSDDPRFDWDWHASPVGAAVIVSIEGDVLAAASEPNESSRRGPDARGQRAITIDRTLRKPTFQPPGSAFKPFVAAYALSEVGLDPGNIVLCGPVEGGSGYKDVRCHARFGHGDVALDRALVVSCNAYFAWLGETLTERDLRRVAELFGFGQPTGVRAPPPWDPGLRRRGGLLERRAGMAARPFSEFDRRLAGNGLGVVEATPMQLARATLALVTGELRDLRLVRRIGERDLPPGARRPLPLSEASLQRVRQALVAVGERADGSAHGALSSEALGFPVAIKTGSADLTGRSEEGRRVVRKHTWVEGWVPAEDPVAVFLVFVHDTVATSSHGAVYLARQLLLQPEVLSWLAESGVDVSQVHAR